MAMDGSATTIEVTPEAATKLQELRADDPKRAFLRLYVSGRSCCSFMYGLAFDENADETDAVTDAAGLKVAIDAQSLPYCDGARVEWVDGPEGTGFLVRNPSIGGSCGCGGQLNPLDSLAAAKPHAEGPDRGSWARFTTRRAAGFHRRHR